MRSFVLNFITFEVELTNALASKNLEFYALESKKRFIADQNRPSKSNSFVGIWIDMQSWEGSVDAAFP